MRGEHTWPPPPCDGWRRAVASAHPRDRCHTADQRRASSPPSAAWLKTRRYDALGVATFGPVDLDPASPTYGYITTTPKPGWKHTDVLGPLRAIDPSAPVLFDTDVNAPQRRPKSAVSLWASEARGFHCHLPQQLGSAAIG